MSRIVRISAMRAAARRTHLRAVGYSRSSSSRSRFSNTTTSTTTVRATAGARARSCREPTIISSPQQQQPWTACAVRSTPSLHAIPRVTIVRFSVGMKSRGANAADWSATAARERNSISMPGWANDATRLSVRWASARRPRRGAADSPST